MKQLCLIITMLSVVIFSNAQKNFEGIITYRLHASIGDKPDAELKIFFGTKKIKLLFKEKEEYAKNALIILLDSTAAYALDVTEKTFRKTTLALSAPAKKPEKKLFSGYAASPLKTENTGLSGLLGGMLGTSNAVLYVADSLHYYIPAAFAGNKELVMIQQNRIVLGAEIEIISAFKEFSDSTTNNNIITVDAIDIKPLAVAETEFTIPADFTDKKDMLYTEPVTDSSVVVPVTDTAIEAPVKPVIKSAKKKPAKAATSKSAPKAARRKEN